MKKKPGGGKMVFTVSLTNDKEMRRLNRKHRGFNHSTDVLSFELKEKLPQGEWVGEVVVAKNFAQKQARRLGHSYEEEVAFLVAHGVMHLLGVHHDESPKFKMQKSKIKMK